jgi:hypothetical protein
LGNEQATTRISDNTEPAHILPNNAAAAKRSPAAFEFWRDRD